MPHTNSYSYHHSKNHRAKHIRNSVEASEKDTINLSIPIDIKSFRIIDMNGKEHSMSNMQMTKFNLIQYFLEIFYLELLVHINHVMSAKDLEKKHIYIEYLRILRHDGSHQTIQNVYISYYDILNIHRKNI